MLETYNTVTFPLEEEGRNLGVESPQPVKKEGEGAAGDLEIHCTVQLRTGNGEHRNEMWLIVRLEPLLDALCGQA